MISPADLPKSRLRLMLDSNVFIAVEPFAGAIEPSAQLGSQLVRLAIEQGHLLCVAEATRDDLLRGRDPVRRAQRLTELQKFHQLQEVPISSRLEQLAGSSRPGSNDHRDLRILAALQAGAATHLITEDDRLRRRARRVGLGDAVLSVVEAVDLLTRFSPAAVEPPPRVSQPPTYTIDTEQRIFESLRSDYPEFDDWLDKVRAESDSRSFFVVTAEGEYAAVALLKSESLCDYPFPGPVLKISTFKVSGDHAGVKYGELLLKAILCHAAGMRYASTYVEVFSSHQVLIDFLSDFGFVDSEAVTARGERVLLKNLAPVADASSDCSDLEYHVRFGPPALRPTQQEFVVPIQPRWHDQLFPELAPRTDQPSLFSELDVPSTHPWGNSLRKAYLCNSPIRQMRPGDLLLFYRSYDTRSISAIGIVEDVLRSQNASEVITFVGRRTVYSPTEIAGMCGSSRGVLAIRFRQDRFVEPPLEYAELISAGVLRGTPQTVTKVRSEGREWILQQILGSL